MSILAFEDFKVWQKGHALVLQIYRLTKNFPQEERFGLIAQIRRSCASVCANIAEGHRKSTRDFIRYLEIARSSLDETRYHLILSKDLGYCTGSDYQTLNDSVEEISKMLNSLTRKLRLKLNF